MLCYYLGSQKPTGTVVSLDYSEDGTAQLLTHHFQFKTFHISNLKNKCQNDFLKKLTGTPENYESGNDFNTPLPSSLLSVVKIIAAERDLRSF